MRLNLLIRVNHQSWVDLLFREIGILGSRTTQDLRSILKFICVFNLQSLADWIQCNYSYNPNWQHQTMVQDACSPSPWGDSGSYGPRSCSGLEGATEGAPTHSAISQIFQVKMGNNSNCRSFLKLDCLFRLLGPVLGTPKLYGQCWGAWVCWLQDPISKQGASWESHAGIVSSSGPAASGALAGVGTGLLCLIAWWSTGKQGIAERLWGYETTSYGKTKHHKYTGLKGLQLRFHIFGCHSS